MDCQEWKKLQRKFPFKIVVSNLIDAVVSDVKNKFYSSKDCQNCFA